MKKGSVRVWLIILIVVASSIGGIMLARELSPQPTPPPAVVDEEAPPAEIRSIVITDDEVEPLLPLSGASLHFMPGNKVQMGYKLIPIKPVLSLGVTGGRLWFSGIPSWIKLEGIDENIYDYFSRENPDWEWSFTVDLSSEGVDTLTTRDGLVAQSATPTFDWSTVDYGEEDKHYTIEISTSEDFSTPVISKKGWSTPSEPFTSYTLNEDEALAEGTYYWRLIEKGKLWITKMPPWLDISNYDPEVTKLPTIVSVETEEGEIKLSYIPQ